MNKGPVELLKQHYRFNEWMRPAATDRQLFVRHYLVNQALFPQWRQERVRTLDLPGMPRYVQTLWRNQSRSNVVVRIDTYECSSNEGARELLLNTLGNTQHGLNQQFDDFTGEISFGSAGDNAWVFVRGNLLIRMTNIDAAHVPLRHRASEIDNDLMDQSTSADTRAASPRRSPIKQFAFEKSIDAIHRDEEVAVNVAMDESESGPVCCRFFYTGGEMRLDKQKLLFRATTDKPAEIDLYATTPNAHMFHQRLTVNPSTDNRP